MRISDWSSDVCSSDLNFLILIAVKDIISTRMASDRSGFAARYRSSRQRLQFQRHMFNHMTKPCPLLHPPQEASRLGIAAAVPGKAEIGRASCREGVCQYV